MNAIGGNFSYCWGTIAIGSYHGGELPRHFLSKAVYMKELSIFVDESGDFGEFEHHSPYYIVTLLFHNQADDITNNINIMNDKLKHLKLPVNPIHTAPLVRREYEYKILTLLERKQIFNAIYNFTRTSKITYHSVIVDKRQCIKEYDLIEKLSKNLSSFLKKHMMSFMDYDRIVCYYDYGQRELTHILITAFNIALNNVEFTKVAPANYKLFQATDLLCTMELLSLKLGRKTLTKSELIFFTSARDLEKSYMNAIIRKRFP